MYKVKIIAIWRLIKKLFLLICIFKLFISFWVSFFEAEKKNNRFIHFQLI